uniref:Uncharacterized protein n=1 Tax=Mycena chlorophos TaxID=658473 RepID=A0ABQ0M3R0_MYCCL|nr:predicted protein [Mycena chlorophos]
MSKVPEFDFLVSQKSVQQKRNLVIFKLNNFPRLLVGAGINLKQHPGMTAQKFYRWLDELIGDEPHTFQLRTIKPMLADLLCYVQSQDQPPGEAIPRNSDALLQAGTYALFNEGSADSPYCGSLGPPYEVLSLKEAWKSLEGLDNTMQVTEETYAAEGNSLIQSLAVEQKSQCFLTKRTGIPLLQVWIFPETMRWGHGGLAANTECWEILANLITIGVDLFPVWCANLISLDCNDPTGCRMVVFDELSKFELSDDTRKALEKQKKKVPFLIPQDPEIRKFWNMHFPWTLRVHVGGGDLTDDIDESELLNVVDDLDENNRNGDFRFGDSKFNPSGDYEHLGAMVKEVWMKGKQPNESKESGSGSVKGEERQGK